jgi:glycosyltransferase involved in cell wall biosynthesis
MKIAILWNCLTGYLNACLKELVGRDGVELFVCHNAGLLDSPFDDRQFAWIKNRLAWRSFGDLQQLEGRLEAFDPDVIVFSGWLVPSYRRVARRFANRAWRVMTMDNCWLGNVRQRLGVVIGRAYVRPLADAVWVPGERQAILARKLGFEQHTILRGLYSCDQPVFLAARRSQETDERPLPRSFLFVGRFVPEKGLTTLVKAYMSYRKATTDPWPLVCCGAGPLRSQLEGKEGIIIKGFVQPSRLPAVLASAGCLVLASTFEPWAVVVHEAASAGLPILASEKVGAAVHLVQPNYNGFIFGNGDEAGLAASMKRISDMKSARREEMSQASLQLSRQFSPGLWADVLLESYSALAKDLSLDTFATSDTSIQRGYVPVDGDLSVGETT